MRRAPRRRCEQEDRRKPALAEERREIFGLFGRVVDDQHPVDACFGGAIGETLRAHRFDRIGVTHQHDGCRRVGRAKRSDHRQHVGEADTLRERTLGGALDHGAVGHRIGKRYAQFYDVRAALGECVHELHGLLRIRVARGDERNQPFLALRGQRRKRVLDTGHGNSLERIR